MPIAQIKLLINMVQKLKGSGHAVFLLSRLIKTNQEKFTQFREQLQQSTEEADQYLFKLAGSIAERFEAGQSDEQHNKPQISKRINYSQTSKRAHSAKQSLQKRKNREGMLTKDDVDQFLKRWLERLYERVKIDGALTFDQLPKYLAQFASEAQPIMSQISKSRQEELVDAFNAETGEMLDDFSKKGNITEDQAKRIKHQIQQKTGSLKKPPDDKPAETAEEVPEVSSEEVSADQEDRSPVAKAPEQVQNFDQILKSEKITIGFEDKSPIMTLADFFTLPLGDRSGPDEDAWFDYHKRYIELAVEKKVIKKEVLDVIDDIIKQLPILKYKKYFNIFPIDELEETMLFAVHDVWSTGALENLRV